MIITGHVTPGTNYSVRNGDSLWVIAALAYGNGAEWRKIYDTTGTLYAFVPSLSALAGIANGLY